MPMPSWVDAPYVRVFITLVDDYPAIWRSDELLAWWLRMLVGADRHYPASAPIPIDTPTVVLDSLEAASIIDVEGTRYRFHGLAQLRSTTSNRGRRGGLARAEGAIRVAGRFAGADAGDATLVDAGPWNGSDAGEDAGPTLVTPAGDPLLVTSVATSEPAKRTEDIDVETPLSVSTSSAPTTPAGAGARAREEASTIDPTAPVSPGLRAAMVRDHGPDDAECDEPEMHALHHRWYAGVGWRCVLCERADTRSFDDLFVGAGGKLPPRRAKRDEPSGSPF